MPFSLNNNAVAQIVIDNFNQKWIVSPGNGLICFNSGQSIDNTGDDKWKLYGTGKGTGNGIVIGAVMVFRDVGAALERSRKALYQAQHDALTHLPNRSLLNDHLTQAIQLCKRYDKPLAVGFLDVDGLKAVNDTHGHAVGDRILSSVASRLRQALRQSDSVGRVGGDEFVIVLSEIAHDADAALVGQKLLQAIATPHRVNGRAITISASLGLALYPDDGLTAKDLIAHADVAMYTAKRGGHGTCQFFQAGMTFGSSAVRNGTAG